MSLISTSQINPIQFQQAVQLYASGASFSGNFLAYVNASGYLGSTVVYASGGAQVIAGAKTFVIAPVVPYGGTTGQTIPRLYVDNQDAATSGVLTGQIGTLSGFLFLRDSGISGALTSLRVTGSTNLIIADWTGIGGTQIMVIGNTVFVSGAAGGGAGSSTVQVTGSSAIASPNFTGVGFTTVSYDGTFIRVSGASDPALATQSGYNEVTFVHRTPVDEQVFGIKIFTGNPQIAAPVLPSGATNLLYVSGQIVAASGALRAFATGISGALNGGGGVTNNFFITGTGTVVALSTGTTSNTFNVTSGNTFVNSSGTVSNTFNGSVTNNVNVSGITGNFVNMSFWYDENNLFTGVNTIESFVSRDFTFTGYAEGVINSGTQGTFSGSFYQRTPSNTKVTFVNFGLPPGQFFSGRGGFSQVISGMNRVGVDIYSVGTGFTGLSLGLFGVGY